MSILAALSVLMLRLSGGVLSVSQRVNQNVYRDNQVRVALDQMARDLAQARIGFSQTQMRGNPGQLPDAGTGGGSPTHTSARLDVVTGMSRLSEHLVSELQQVTYQTLDRAGLETLLTQVDPGKVKLRTAWRELESTEQPWVVFLVRTVVEPTFENYEEKVWNPMAPLWWDAAPQDSWQKTTHPRVTILLKGLIRNDHPDFTSSFNYFDSGGEPLTDFITRTEADTPASIVVNFTLLNDDALKRPFETLQPSDKSGSYSVHIPIPPSFDPTDSVR